MRIVQTIDRLANELESKGLSKLAAELDMVANTIEKEASNRRMREFLVGKLKEWFPDKVTALVKAGLSEVLYDLVDNISATYLEIATPGRNKTLDIDEMYVYTDKKTKEKQDHPITYLHTNFFPSRVSATPTLKGMPQSFYQEMGRVLSRAVVEQSSKESVSLEHLVTEQGQPKANTLEYLFKKMIPRSIVFFDPKTKTRRTKELDPGEVAKELATEISKSSANVLVNMLSGQLSRSDSPQYKQIQSTGVKPDFRWTSQGKAEEEERLMKEVTTSRALKDKLAILMDTVWTGPESIPVDVQHLSKTFDPGQVAALIGRIHNIQKSVGYKDEERLEGSKDRLSPYPGPTVPWNPGKELILGQSMNSSLYSIREGWHRLMAMLVEVAEAGQTKFTISAYIVRPPGIPAIKQAIL